MLIGAGVAVVVAALVAATVLVGGNDRRTVETDEAAAAVRAGEACDRFAALLDVVDRNGPAAEATHLLDAMADGGTEAARLDPRWTQLASGMHALRLGFREDDRDATRIGVDLVRAGCAEVDR